MRCDDTSQAQGSSNFSHRPHSTSPPLNLISYGLTVGRRLTSCEIDCPGFLGPLTSSIPQLYFWIHSRPGNESGEELVWVHDGVLARSAQSSFMIGACQSGTYRVVQVLDLPHEPDTSLVP